MGGTVTVRYGSVGDAYPNAWTTVFTAYAYALVVDFTEVRVLLRDRLFLLDKPIVTGPSPASAGSAAQASPTRSSRWCWGGRASSRWC